MNVQDIQNLYAQYLEAAERAEQNRTPAEGLFGFGRKPADDPCHTEFIDALEAALRRLAEEKPESGAVRSTLAYIYQMPLTQKSNPAVYWMLIAAHGLTEDLISLLTEADAGQLLAEYGRNYRKWERLPVQKNVLRALKTAANER